MITDDTPELEDPAIKEIVAEIIEECKNKDYLKKWGGHSLEYFGATIANRTKGWAYEEIVKRYFRRIIGYNIIDVPKGKGDFEFEKLFYELKCSLLSGSSIYAFNGMNNDPKYIWDYLFLVGFHRNKRIHCWIIPKDVFFGWYDDGLPGFRIKRGSGKTAELFFNVNPYRAPFEQLNQYGPYSLKESAGKILELSKINS